MGYVIIVQKLWSSIMPIKFKNVEDGRMCHRWVCGRLRGYIS
jgi:hypothetical protein